MPLGGGSDGPSFLKKELLSVDIRKYLQSRTGAVVAGAAVLATLSGVAGAAAAGLITSADIKDETIRQRDIRTGGVGSSEVANGSLKARDLSSAARSKIKLSAVPSGMTIRGVVGADYHNTVASGTADWGIDVSLPMPARNALSDGEVEVDVQGWQDGGGQTAPTSGDDGNATCAGTPTNPTAPPGIVCIYVAGADNAANVVGYSVLPGTGQSRYGFKLKWDIPIGAGDTFVDAVWAYTAP
jgi:hypothetical protein